MNSILFRFTIFAAIVSLNIDCEVSDEKENTGEMTAGETTAGETTAGETTAGETTAGETTAGETTAGETTAGETTAGMSSPTDLSEWNVKFNALFNALAAGQERLCANCPEDNYCSEGDGDMPLTDEEVSCILENLNEDQLSILETAFECQAVQIAQFEMCTAEPVCDDSYFTCLGELLNDESCAPEGSSDIDSALPDLGAACFGETACADGSGSFSEDDTCDGFDDCEDGEDEQNCD